MGIDEELTAAEAAKAAIDRLSVSASNRQLLPTLGIARRIAITNLSSEGLLNDARRKVGIALSNLSHGPPRPEKIDKPKRAVEEWINRLRMARPRDGAIAARPFLSIP
jgi:hypothetical protein